MCDCNDVISNNKIYNYVFFHFQGKIILLKNPVIKVFVLRILHIHFFLDSLHTHKLKFIKDP